MLNVCIICSQSLPVPAVKGGAIEALVTMLADENEKEPKINLTIVTKYDKDSAEVIAQYKNTKWIIIPYGFIDKLSLFSLKAIRRITGKTCNISLYDKKAFSKVKNGGYDKIVFEGGNTHYFGKYLKYYDKEKLYMHFHVTWRPEKFVEKIFGHFIAISDYTAKVLTEHINLPCERVITLKNCIDVDKYAKPVSDSERKSFRTKHGCADSDFVIVYCGRLIPEKGVKELAEAVTELSEGYKLLIFGKKDGLKGAAYLRILEGLCAKSQGIVKLCGYVNSGELYRCYNAGDCIAVPTIIEEGAGLVVIEAQAAGKYVVASKRGGIPEFAHPEYTSFVETGTNFVTNLKNAIADVKGRHIKDRKIEKEEISKYTQLFSSKKYYINFVDIMLDGRDDYGC